MMISNIVVQVIDLIFVGDDIEICLLQICFNIVNVIIVLTHSMREN